MKTNIQAVRQQSKILFDLVSFEDAYNTIPEEYRGLIVAHPYTNMGVTYDSEIKQMIDLSVEENFKKFRTTIFKLIDKSSLGRIFLLVNKPYRLLWFNMIGDYLSEKDYANWLKEVWVNSENPNMDANIPIEKSLQFFRDANPDYLMNKEEKTYFDSLLDKVTVYRGVSYNRTAFGLSYTTDKAKAQWFQKRFANENDKGYLITLNVKKEDCICYLNNRDEKEIILNFNPYIKEICKQIPKEKSYE